VGIALGAILGYIGGFLSKAFFELWKEGRSTPTIETYGFYFDGIPKAIQTLLFNGHLITDEVCLSLPDDERHITDHLRCYVYLIHNAGKTTVRDLKVKAHAKEGSGIGHHTFHVEKSIVCDRLSTELDEDKSITATWRYLNPGDLIEWYVVATGTHERADIVVEVDGDGITCRETFPLDPIKLVNPMKSALISLKNDKLLAKYLELMIRVGSHGDSMPKG
jgi:hypothetical protein